ncbi:hypothetical protein PENSPDRAFT_695639 [Peniophora sp. CONT]|nr:hypothetical protein PENSPDRAFT_695639 [Peniophora sp. CONT]
MRVVQPSDISDSEGGEAMEETYSDTGSADEVVPPTASVHLPERIHVVPDECESPDWDPGFTANEIDAYEQSMRHAYDLNLNWNLSTRQTEFISNIRELHTMISNMSNHLRHLQDHVSQNRRVNANIQREWSRCLRMNNERLQRLMELADDNRRLYDRLYAAQLGEYTANRAHQATYAALQRREDRIATLNAELNTLIDDHALVLTERQRTISQLRADLRETQFQLQQEREHRAERDERRRQAAEERRQSQDVYEADEAMEADDEQSDDDAPERNHRSEPPEPETGDRTGTCTRLARRADSNNHSANQNLLLQQDPRCVWHA